MTKPRFHIATLGCKVNRYESEALRQAWLADGAEEANAPSGADVILVNSCAITARAVSDVRQAVRRLHRAAPQARIILTGCAAGRDETRSDELPGLERVVGQTEKKALLALFSNAVPEATAFPPFSIAGFTRSRPVLKVQDGCSHRCTFCVVPQARGRAVSRPFEDTAAELQRLLDAGFREIVLAGVNLRQFGPDLPGNPDFWDLIAFLEQRFAPDWAGRARLRLSSLEPGQLTEKALETFASSRLLCPHLHLSIQSGSPDVLRRMGRGHYRPEGLVPFFDALARHWPRMGLGADLLVGFPGESESDFDCTMALADALPMTYGHVFPYSARPGTPAATMPEQLPRPVKTERAARLRALLERKQAAFLHTLLDVPLLTVAAEGRKGQGVCEFYNSCEFAADSPQRDGNELLRGKPTAVRGGRIVLTL